MSYYSPSSDFHDAASYLSTASSLSKVSSATKLELYGLFKYVTASPMPTLSRPSIFDMTGRAKWDAWNSAGKAYVNPEDAEHKYLDIARTLGWTEGTTPAPGRKSKSDEGNEETPISDDESNDTRPSSTGDGVGMGNSVSSMAPPPEETDGSLHSLAVSNNAPGVSLLLQEHPETDVNERDEFGYTPLHLASDRGYVAVVEVLLKNGADPTIKDPDDFTAAELARIAGHDGVRAMIPMSTL